MARGIRSRCVTRRQAIGTRYKMFSTDVIRFRPDDINDDVLRRKVLGVKIPKICGHDIDDLEDFGVIDAILSSSSPMADDYVWRPSVPPYKG